MPRPEFPTGIILPPSCIQRIREEQNYYDRDPERAEREQRDREERLRQEQEEMEARERYEYDRWCGEQESQESGESHD